MATGGLTVRTLLLLGGLCLTVTVVAAQPSGPAISIMGDGTLIIQGSAEVPRYSADGQWAEGTPRSSARNAVRHFRFLVPNGPPAIELYVTRDLTNAPPDGAFEIGLVNGFVSSFGAGAGLRPGALVVEEAMVGAAAVKRCRAQLTKGGQALWLYAYIFPRNPSLTFLTLRPQSDASPSIEGYLSGVRLR